MTKEQTCCVTGHRDIPADKIEFVRESLRQEILAAIGEGYTHFISGFAAGVDLIFAEIVAELKDEYPITLEAAIPHPGRRYTSDAVFQALIKRCDTVKIHSDRYFKGSYIIRNHNMVDQSALVMAVYDGRRTGGTAATIKYANETGRTAREIRL